MVKVEAWDPCQPHRPAPKPRCPPALPTSVPPTAPHHRTRPRVMQEMGAGSRLLPSQALDFGIFP